MSCLVVTPTHPLRGAAEDHIRAVYAEAYGATVHTLPRLLVARVDRDGRLRAAAGLRLGWESCFSVCYLDEPVEDLLGRHAGGPVQPSRILEVTTLAGSGGGALGLVAWIVATGHEMGMEWGVFTATRRLRAALRHAGFAPLELAPARRDRVAAPEDWGTYYDSDPRVCAVAGHAVRTVVPVAPVHPLPDRRTGLALHA